MKLASGAVVCVIGVGFIGSHLVRASMAAGLRVRVLDRNVCPEEFMGHVEWIQGDYHAPAPLHAALRGADVVYHLVSSTVPGDLHVDVAKELHDNVVGSLTLMDACVAAGVSRLVFASSASVYGVQEHLPVGESAPTNPISAHGVHKLCVEKFLLMAHRERGLDVRILRLANPYGPGQRLDGRQGFVAIAIGCLKQDSRLTLRDEGRMVRDFVYVQDIADGMLASGLGEDVPRIMNLGAGQGHSLRHVLQIIESLTGRVCKVDYAAARTIDIPSSVLDIRCARSAIDFSPSTGLEEGVRRTLRSHGLLATPG
jgi:UDP-glucose 4-epimerase